MTSDAAVDLAGLYREELSRLSEHFGGYASFWFYCAEKLAGDPPEGEYVPYPLWESAIWGVDPKNSRKVRLPERSPARGEDGRVKTGVAGVSVQGLET